MLQKVSPPRFISLDQKLLNWEEILLFPETPVIANVHPPEILTGVVDGMFSMTSTTMEVKIHATPQTRLTNAI